MRSTEHASVLKFISLIREINPPYMLDIFQNGGCYHLFLILREKWASAEPWYNEGHVYAKIGNRFYDIRGHRRPREVRRLTASEEDDARNFLSDRHRVVPMGMTYIATPTL